MKEISTQDRSIDLTKEGGIIFNESDHTYVNSEGEFYTGITTLLGNYHEHFDTEKVAINKAIKDVIIENYGNKKYKDVISQLGGENVIDEKFNNIPKFMFDSIYNESIKQTISVIHGEDKYLELEKQVKGYDNLITKLPTIKEHRKSLYDDIIEFAKKYFAIISYGSEKYNLLKKQVGGFENLFTKMDELENKRPKLFQQVNNKIKELKEEWKATNLRATTEGSVEHDRREQKIYDDGGYSYKGIWFEYIEGKNITNVTIDDIIVIPECMVWNHEMKLGGLADIFLFYKGTIYVLDYKTNATIDIKPKIDNPQFWKYMLGVCSELLDLNYYHYSLQLKIYQMMAIMLRPEFKEGENIIIYTTSETHYRDEDATYECYDVSHIVPQIFNDVRNKIGDE